MSAALRGCRRSHSGLNGALAHPIIERVKIKERIGITTMPHGSRWMCGTGFSETCPPRAAVSSPPSLATSACAASWHVVENRNATYHTNPYARSWGENSGMNLEPRGSANHLQLCGLEGQLFTRHCFFACCGELSRHPFPILDRCLFRGAQLPGLSLSQIAQRQPPN